MPFPGLDHSFLLATLVALVPGLAAWWSGRDLMPRLDDPVLPERLMAHQRRNGVVMVLAFAASTVVEPRALPLTIPLMFSATIAASYPLRRAMFSETWSFAAHLSFFHRLTLAVFGFWIVLGATPALASMAGRFDWVAGAIAAGVLIAWNRNHAKVLRYLLRCRPLHDDTLLARFRLLAAKCPLPEPLFLRADLNGGALANALALPSLRGNAVIFTGTLLDRLNADEITAICGHELAHLEYYNAARLKRLGRMTTALIVLGAGVTPLSRLFEIESIWTYLSWFGVVLGVIATLARDKQRQETVCDARAVELTGDPEPLVSALTKLYATARLPRRIAAPQDRAASHPSLSRRIRDIRRAAGLQPAVLPEAVTVYSADGAAVVSFEGSRLHWERAAGVTEVIAYEHLHELRLDVGRRGGPRLCATSDAGRCWEMRVSSTDVPRLQAVLDRVDGRLGDAPAPRGLPLTASRLIVAILSLLALSIGQLTVAVVVLLASLRPARPLVGGAAAAALWAALLAIGDSPIAAESLTPYVLGLAGAILVTLTFINRHDETRSIRLPLSVLGALAALLAVSILLAGFDPIRLHQSARTTPALPVVLVSIAAALAWTGQRRARLAGAALTLLAVSTTALSSLAFLDTFGRDPFLLETPALAFEKIQTGPLERFALPESTSRVQLSPGGRYIAAQQDSNDEDDRTPTFLLGRLGDSLKPVAARTIHFTGDDTVLLGADDENGTTLHQIRLNSTHDVLWRQRVPQLRAAMLGLSREGRWHLEGWKDEETILRVQGTVGAADVQERRWEVADARDAWIDAMTTAGSHALVVETRYDGGLLRHLPARAWRIGMLLRSGSERSRYWISDGKSPRQLGESHFGAHCPAAAVEGALLCSVYDGTRTRLIRMDARDGSISAIGRLEGRFIAVDGTVDGWLTGWQDSTAVAIDIVNRRALRAPSSDGPVGGLSVSGNRLAVIVMTAEGPQLDVYRLPEPNVTPSSLKAGAPRAPESRSDSYLRIVAPAS